MENANISHGSPVAVPPPDSRPGSLREATREFESLFVAQMMHAMRSTVPDGGLFGGGDGQQLFREMLDQELSRRAAYAGGFGIGEMLYRQLSGDQPAAQDQGSEDHESR